MSTHTCTLKTACNSHPVLHRLHEIAKEMTSEYDEVDFPHHGLSTKQGEVFLTRTVSDGTRIPIKISQVDDRQLHAELLDATQDAHINISEAVYPLVNAYLGQHTDPCQAIEQHYLP